MKLLLALALAASAAERPRLKQGVQGPWFGCDAAQRAAVEKAAGEASSRIWKAKEKAAGLSMRDERLIELERKSTLRLFELVVGEKPDDDLGFTLGSMFAELGEPRLDVRCAAKDDKYCQARSAYVKRGEPGIWVCPGFFRNKHEERVRTLVHEAAHRSGIGQAEGESYCPTFDCETSCGGKKAADAWSHFVHCAADGKPDKPLEL